MMIYITYKQQEALSLFIYVSDNNYYNKRNKAFLAVPVMIHMEHWNKQKNDWEEGIVIKVYFILFSFWKEGEDLDLKYILH